MTGVIFDTGTMSEVPQYTETVVQSLSLQGLFHFPSEAREQIDSFYSHQINVKGFNLPPDVTEQGRALSYLHAAEYALLPVINNPDRNVLPPAQSILVSDDHTRLALMKGDCSLILWTHAPAQDRINSLHISDLTAFSGDGSKARRVIGSPWPEDIVPNTSEVEMYARELYGLYMNDWGPAAAVAWSGVIQLQGLLWCLKSAVVEFRTEAQFRQYLEYIPQYVSELEQQPWTPEGETLSERAGLSEGPTFTDQWRQLMAEHEQGVLPDTDFAQRRSELQLTQARTMYERNALTDGQFAAARARIEWDEIDFRHGLGTITDDEFDEARARLLGT